MCRAFVLQPIHVYRQLPVASMEALRPEIKSKFEEQVYLLSEKYGIPKDTISIKYGPTK